MNTVAGLSDIIPSGLTPRPKASLLRPAIKGLARLGARVVEEVNVDEWAEETAALAVAA